MNVLRILGTVAGMAFPCGVQTIEKWMYGAWTARGRPQKQYLNFSWPRLLQMSGRQPYSSSAAHTSPWTSSKAGEELLCMAPEVSYGSGFGIVLCYHALESALEGP